MDLADLAMKRAELPRTDTLLQQSRAATTDPELIRRLDLLEGSLRNRQGRIPAARTILLRLLADSRRAQDPYHEAGALLNLSLCKHAESRYDEELDLARQALEIATRNGVRRLEAGAHTNIGNALGRLGDFERAHQELETSRKIYSAIGDIYGMSGAEGNLGVAYSLENNPVKSAAAFKRAYELALEVGIEPSVALWSANLASAAIEAGQWDQAETSNEIAAEIARRKDDQRRLTFVIINRALIAEGRKRHDEAIRLCREALERSKTEPGLQWEIHSHLGQIYVNLDQFDKARPEFEAAFRNIETARSTLDSGFKITLLSRLIRLYQRYVDALVEEGSNEKALQVAESSRARVLAERIGLSGTTTQTSPAQLKHLAASTHSVFLSYWLAPRRSFVWRITGQEIRLFKLPPADQLEQLITPYRKQVEGDPLAPANDGTDLWNTLLAPVAAGIPRNSRVVIVPDGALHRLNLETLKTPAARYWIEDVMLSVAPALSVLSPGHAGPRRPSLLLIGAPVEAHPSYPPLPKANAELAGIQAAFPQSAIYRGAQATPAAYRTAGPERFSLIHFTAHAEGIYENPLESAVILSRDNEQFKLYARDVAGIPIRADLVTISACKSAGVRTYAGEGLIGFAWAFLQAGAHNVVAGLWDVSDTSTEPLMKEFYKALAAGQESAAALRTAKLSMLHGQYRKPYFWAPFQIYVRSL